MESVVGQGSRFTFTLPVASHPQSKLYRRSRNLSKVGGSVNPAVLVVEDDPQAAELLSLYLEGAGYRVGRWPGMARTALPRLVRFTLPSSRSTCSSPRSMVGTSWSAKGGPRTQGGCRWSSSPSWMSVAKGLPWARLITWLSR